MAKTERVVAPQLFLFRDCTVGVVAGGFIDFATVV